MMHGTLHLPPWFGIWLISATLSSIILTAFFIYEQKRSNRAFEAMRADIEEEMRRYDEAGLI